MTDYTLLPDQSSFAVHDVYEVTGKEVLATDNYPQAVVGGKIQSNMQVFLSRGREASWMQHRLSSIVTHYAR